MREEETKGETSGGHSKAEIGEPVQEKRRKMAKKGMRSETGKSVKKKAEMWQNRALERSIPHVAALSGGKGGLGQNKE